jgi:hypothetical protein
MFSPIFINVLAKSRLRLLPPSKSTRVNCEPTTTGSRTSGNFLGSEKLVHWPSLEKEIGTSQYLRGFYMASSIERILCRISFCACLEGKPPSPPKIMLTTFSGLGSLEPPTCHPHHHPPDASTFHLEEVVER